MAESGRAITAASGGSAISAAEMQAAIAKHKMQTGRTSPYDNAPPDGAPASPMPQVANPEAAPVPQPMPPLPSPLPPPPSSPAPAAGPPPQIVAVGQPVPTYRMGMNGQMLPVGMSASPGAAYSASYSGGGMPSPGEPSDPIAAQMARAVRGLTAPMPADRESAQGMLGQMQALSSDKQHNQIEAGKLDVARTSAQTARMAALFDQSIEGQVAARAKTMPGGFPEEAQRQFISNLETAGFQHLPALMGTQGLAKPTAVAGGGLAPPGGQGPPLPTVPMPGAAPPGHDKTTANASPLRAFASINPQAASLALQLESERGIPGYKPDSNFVLDRIHNSLGDEGLVNNKDTVRAVLNHLGVDSSAMRQEYGVDHSILGLGMRLPGAIFTGGKPGQTIAESYSRDEHAKKRRSARRFLFDAPGDQLRPAP